MSSPACEMDRQAHGRLGLTRRKRSQSKDTLAGCRFLSLPVRKMAVGFRLIRSLAGYARLSYCSKFVAAYEGMFWAPAELRHYRMAFGGTETPAAVPDGFGRHRMAWGGTELHAAAAHRCAAAPEVVGRHRKLSGGSE